ncbi:thioredoxin family protein [Staphylococcus saprophyticus]|uniref:Thioredoxin n=2 Tax=Staphylococcus saprophyticus TaxID=29385 RepID=A0A380HLR1_STASA|nr:thioredoxin family protein [Staphylococcus saprophyticus]KIJ86927.1 thioredoxin [Staphylococcus saprophyticus]MBN6092745.1 thioredoxin family protein [Staphylococcus saprophyticus]MBN6095121.1 thioredoxin family protein [Staphylococcus saprophyticus]MBN6096729.1 thioredoxin family protein [Staphylococcus saprophyticus]MBN6099517.1 thioredoxin family protein [Staphylococcus saprophyticus]
MTSLETYFKNSQPLDQYIEVMTENKENVLSIYNSFSLPLNDDRIKKIKSLNYSKVLVITEDWCGDAMMNLPILKHISEALNLEVRVFHRDENTDLIDQYLTNGTARSIPIFVFLNDNFEQETVWGPRARQVQHFVEDTRSDVPSKDDPTFEDKSAEAHKIMTNRYKTDSQLWKYVYDSILDKLIIK